MFAYIWPVVLIVTSNVLYQICAKSLPEKMNPFASLTVTYIVGAAVSFVLYYALNRGANILEEYRRLNWAPFVFGIVLAGLEAGSLYAYKAGWAVSTLTATKNAFLAALLLLVGFLLYKEPLTANKLVGTVICLVGLYIINK